MSSIKAFLPGFKYLSVSITGNSCSLMCDFCRARYLNGMKKVLTPKEFYDLIKYLVKNGVRGILVSGGFSEEGYLPIEPYLPIIRDVKREFNIVVSVHAGLVDKSLAIKLREAGVDIVDYEVLLDSYVIKELMHLRRRSPEDFMRSYEVLVNYGPPYIVPHIPVGMNYGRVLTEFNVVDAVATYKPEIMVFLIFVPTEGTPLATIKPPDDEDVIKLLSYSRNVFKGGIALGCMRPFQKKYSLDFKLVELGLIDRVVNPLKSLINRYKLEVVEACCSVPKELLSTLTSCSVIFD